MTLPLREIEGKYEILHKIREGGMGAIYKVRHRLLDEARVIKVIRPQLAQNVELQQRFKREAKTAIRLRHPNIAQIYDFALDERGAAYIVMEFIDGVTVAELLTKAGSPGLGLGLEIAHQGLRALAYLHEVGYLHRDIATDNVMLARRHDGTALVKLIDLGVAKRLGGDGELTQTGTFLGKVRYASPEQFGDGKRELDQRSDIYSFGVVLYELLTGRYPIAGKGFSEIIAGHLFRPPLSFADSDPEGRLPEGVRVAIAKALAKDPDERFADAEKMAAALAPFTRPARELRRDLDRTMATTTMVLPEAEPAEPGSTQSRLDAQFGLATTPPPTPPGPQAVPAAASTPPAEGEERRRRIEALLEDARLMARLEQLEKAEQELDRLLALDPDHEQGRELMASVRAARRQRREAGRRLGAARRALAAGEVEKAGRELEQARRSAPAEAALPQLTETLRKAREKEARRTRDLAAAVERAGELLDGGDLDGAEAELERAAGRFGAGEQALAGLRDRVGEARRLASEAAAQEHLAAARRHCESGDFDAALDAVASALALDSGHRQAQALEAEIARRRQSGEWERPDEAAGERRVEELVAHARRLAEGGARQLARRRLEEALALAPEHSEARWWLARLEAGEGEEGGEAAGPVAEAARSIGRALDDGRLEQASRELEFALGRYGRAPELLALERGLRAARGLDRTLDPRRASPAEPPAVDTHTLPAAVAGARARRRPRRPWLLAAALAAVVLAAVLGVYLARRGAGPAPTAERAGETAAVGRLVVDARPEARLEEVRDAGGETFPVGPDPRTPLQLTLPAGRYTLTLSRGGVAPDAPPGSAETRRLEVEVRRGAVESVVIDFDRPAGEPPPAAGEEPGGVP